MRPLLVELLVVIAIIGVLADIAPPSLARANFNARAICCVNNLKQLQVCCGLYAGDFEGFLPPNNSLASLPTGSSLSEGQSWCINRARLDVQPDGIQDGVLFPYNMCLDSYRCPADRSMVETVSGEKTGVRRWRSYNLSQSVNGFPARENWMASYLPSFRKASQIIKPGPSGLLAFVEVHEDSISDAVFGIPTQAYGGCSRLWWDLPASRHNQGATFSFADGHVETWNWQLPKKVIQRFAAQYVPEEEVSDYERVKRGIRQTWN